MCVLRHELSCPIAALSETGATGSGEPRESGSEPDSALVAEEAEGKPDKPAVSEKRARQIQDAETARKKKKQKEQKDNAEKKEVRPRTSSSEVMHVLFRDERVAACFRSPVTLVTEG